MTTYGILTSAKKLTFKTKRRSNKPQINENINGMLMLFSRSRNLQHNIRQHYSLSNTSWKANIQKTCTKISDYQCCVSVTHQACVLLGKHTLFSLPLFTETASGRLLASPVSQTIALTNLHLPSTQTHTSTLTSNTSQNCHCTP